MGKTVTKTGNILKVVCDDPKSNHFKKSRNVVTDCYVALCRNDLGVETNLLGNDKLYTFEKLGTIGTVSVTTNEELFTELEKMLS